MASRSSHGRREVTDTPPTPGAVLVAALSSSRAPAARPAHAGSAWDHAIDVIAGVNETPPEVPLWSCGDGHQRVHGQ